MDASLVSWILVGMIVVSYVVGYLKGYRAGWLKGFDSAENVWKPNAEKMLEDIKEAGRVT